MQDEREGENAEKNFFAALFTGGLLRKDYLMVSGLVLSPILMLVMCFLLQESVNAEVAWSIGAAISIPFLTYVRRPVGARVCGVWLLRGTGIEGRWCLVWSSLMPFRLFLSSRFMVVCYTPPLRCFDCLLDSRVGGRCRSPSTSTPSS